MAAKDYKICPALFNAYIAKVSKKDPNLMLSDRREITDSEIFALIIWKLDKFCIENETDTMNIIVEGNPIVEIKAKGSLLDRIKEIIKEEDND